MRTGLMDVGSGWRCAGAPSDPTLCGCALTRVLICTVSLQHGAGLPGKIPPGTMGQKATELRKYDT